jgi:NTE family protein
MKNLPSRYFILDEALQKESKWDGKPIEALALSGGGIKGIAFGGAVQKLDEAGMYGEIKNFAGTSAGSGFASLLAVGYSGKEVSHILSSTPIGKIMMAGSWNCLWRLYRRSGLYTLGPFVKFMDELFQQRLSGVKMCTFEQLYRQRGVNLVIPAINLDEQALVYLSHETNPRMPIAIACAASSAAPVMFEPVLWKGELLYF